MSVFDIDQTAAVNSYENALSSPIWESDLKPSWYSGAWKAPFTGLASTVNDAALLLGDATTPMLRMAARPVDQLFGTKTEDWLNEQQQIAVDNISNWSPDPRTTGWLGMAGHGLINVIPEAMLGGPETAAALQGYKGFRRSVAEGIDPATALGVGSIEGVATYAGMKLPMTFAAGAPLYANLGLAVGTNLAVGAATRGGIGGWLEARGYSDMASQYRVLDQEAMMVDTIMGLGFGAYGHYVHGSAPETRPLGEIAPSELDAALAANNHLHVEVDTLPGVPTDPAARQAHVEAVNKAIEDLLAGRDVTVNEAVTQASFEEKQQTPFRTNADATIREHLGSDWERVQEELRSRGLPDDPNLYNIDQRSPVRFTDNVRGAIKEWEKTGDTEALLMRLKSLNGDLEERAVANAGKRFADRERGELWVRERLMRAERHGDISPEQHALAKWLIDKNPAIADELAISLRGSGRMSGEAGSYNPAERLVTLIKGAGDAMTGAHEFLHHSERMMPEEVRKGVREAWINSLERLQRTATETQNHPLMQAIDDALRAAAGDREAFKLIASQIADGTLPKDFYQYVNPSEFWAVNAARLVAQRAGAKTWIGKAKQWLAELVEKIKSVFGLSDQDAIIKGLDAVLKSDGEIYGKMIGQGDFFPDVTAGKPGVEKPGVGVEDKNVNGFEPALRVKVPLGKIALPEKPLVLTGTNMKNAGKQLAGIDDALAKFPNADKSPLEWSRMMAYAMATDDVPIPPYRFLKEINSDGAVRKLETLTPGQIADADHGFENARLFREAYTSGELDVETTGKLFMWSFLSRGVSPYTQEGLFIDAYPGIGEWLKVAAEGSWDESRKAAFDLGSKAEREKLADLILQGEIDGWNDAKKKAEKEGKEFNKPEPTRIEWDENADGTVNLTYSEWARTAAPKGSGQPGSGATHNLNAFGNLFLAKMSEKDADGVSKLQRMHEMMSDPNMTGQAIRRWFIANTEGVGIDNKVVSFTLLVAGFPDVMVLDRVQIRQLWDDGRFEGRNLYDGRKVNNKVVPGTSLAEITYGARGLLIYEAVERALAKRVENMYTALGRPHDASIGRYHWETWVADSQQEASHGTLDAILHDAKGNPDMISEVTAKEGEYGAYQYGARYGRTAAGEPYFLYKVGEGQERRYTVEGFREFMDAVKSTKNGVVPAKFKVTEAGNAPWYERPEVNQQRLDELAAKYAVPSETEGAGAVRTPGEGQAVSDRAGRGADPYSAETIIANRPDLTVANESGELVPAGRALAQADAELATAEHESQQFDVAAACALRG
jgi:hypothetical protein